ncbi:MAG: signal peptidase I [Acidobacteria bacterium]|nr:signal peptidase I [Acidobacteriota bacterium]
MLNWLKSKKPAPAPERYWIADWAYNIVMLVWFTSTVAQPFVVPTASMESTIMTGDHLIVDKIPYSPPGPITKYILPYRDVQRGDVVVFRYPLNINLPYVKRVIGVPGDKIKFVENKLFLNGKQEAEPYAQFTGGNTDSYAANFPTQLPLSFIYPRGAEMLRDNVKDGILTVPQGYYLCMGDNRQNSDDSRYWGLVPRENIMGKPLIVWWSFEASTEHLATYSIEQVVNLVTNFFSKTRWERTFMLIRAYPLGREK